MFCFISRLDKGLQIKYYEIMKLLKLPPELNKALKLVLPISSFKIACRDVNSMQVISTVCEND